jgi:hypothetical protein
LKYFIHLLESEYDSDDLEFNSDDEEGGDEEDDDEEDDEDEEGDEEGDEEDEEEDKAADEQSTLNEKMKLSIQKEILPFQ